jgi:hypothetical protein
MMETYGMFCYDFDQALKIAKKRVAILHERQYIYKDAIATEWLVRSSFIEGGSARWILMCETGCYL